MGNLTIAKKFTLIAVMVTLVMLVIGYLVLNNYKNDLIEQTYSSVKNELQYQSDIKIKSKFDVGISNAISISNDGAIKEALVAYNRQMAIDALASLSKNMKDSTPFKNIKVHIHTKNTHSFLRSWKPKKFADDLNSFRHSVVKVNKDKIAVNTFEVGKAGLSIRSVVPIFDKSNNHVGSLEFMQGINSVAKSFDKAGDAFILLMGKNHAVAQFEEKQTLDNYLISQKFVNKNFLADSKTISFSQLLNDGYYISNKYFYTYVDVKDFNGKKLGIALSARPIDKVEIAINQASSIVFVALILLVVALLISMLFSLLNMKTNILNPILNLKNSIDNIKNNNSSESTRIEVKSKDEIGDVVTSFNEYLDGIDDGLKKDRLVIDETRVIIEKVNAGLLNDRVRGHANSKEVDLLVGEINNMIGTMQANLTLLSDTLVALSNARYDHPIPKIEGLTGMVASLFSGTKVTQSTINEVMCLIDDSNEKLSYSAHELSEASTNLSSSSNSQAASLEETAAAIEEISATINKSSENASQMAQYAQNVTQSNNKGKELAYKTSESMEKLSEEVTAIEDAISVIDQIAFQTNILSLNAAVEAATAGEAGKGFAVVAQEVRNLAARSAEAANEIKSIVESATVKAKEGKAITTEMIEGYNELNENITTTIGLIDDVANASREQQMAMGQITDTVNNLDQATQQNASLASTINDMAQTTSTLAQELQSAIDKTSFDKSAKKRICDPNSIVDVNKLKSDHIVFKNTNFAQCKEGHNFTVKNHHECNLGKWIDSNEDKPVAKTQAWKDLKEYHENVHKQVQNTVDLYAEKSDNARIFEVTKDIEVNVDNVFDHLNKVREVRCND